MEPLDRMPPHDLDVERRILGTFIRLPEALAENIMDISPDYFFNPNNRIIYGVILDLHRRDEPLEAINLTRRLRELGSLDDVGGGYYIGQLLLAAGGCSHAKYYTGVLRALYVQRETIRLCMEMAGTTFSDSEMANEALDNLTAKIDALKNIQAGGHRDTTGLANLLEQTMTGQRQAIEWPWRSISRLTYALLPETITILCGHPGSGKSFMLLEAAACWHEAGIKIAVHELEESKAYHLNRVFAQRTRNGNLFDPVWIRNNAPFVRAAFADHWSWLEKFGEHIWATPIETPTLAHLAAWIGDRARDGCRIICVDPVTAAINNSPRSWQDDLEFLMQAKIAAVRYQASVILLTHPRDGSQAWSMDNMAGGRSYQRFAQTILWLEKHYPPKEYEIISTLGGSSPWPVNRALHILKARNGPGGGLSLAMDFHGGSLTFDEKGIISQERKSHAKKNDD